MDSLTPRYKNDPATISKKGIKPEWAALPPRRCDNCGERYKPKQPLREGQKYGFCNPGCKKQFHKHGAAYIKLKDVTEKMVEKRFGQINAELKELRALWIETEARYVELAGRLDKLAQSAAPKSRRAS